MNISTIPTTTIEPKHFCELVLGPIEAISQDDKSARTKYFQKALNLIESTLGVTESTSKRWAKFGFEIEKKICFEGMNEEWKIALYLITESLMLTKRKQKDNLDAINKFVTSAQKIKDPNLLVRKWTTYRYTVGDVYSKEGDFWVQNHRHRIVPFLCNWTLYRPDNTESRKVVSQWLQIDKNQILRLRLPSPAISKLIISNLYLSRKEWQSMF